MTAHPAAPLLAADLGRLPHTNNRGEQGLVHIPGFLSNAGMSEEQAGDVGLLAQAIAEGIIEDLGKHGYLVIAKDEINAKVKALAAEKQATSDDLVLHCNRCHQPVVKVRTAGQAKVHVATMAQGLALHAEVCR